MSVERASQWVQYLRSQVETCAPPTDSPLSTAGFREALRAALTAITTDELASIQKSSLHPPKKTTFIAASTVFTAPIEWAAVSLSLGIQFTIKRPDSALSIWDRWALDLPNVPLHCTPKRWICLRSCI